MILSERNRCFLNFISSTAISQLKSILKTLTQHQLQLLVEIIFNIIQGVIPISGSVKKRLAKHSKAIRNVVVKGLTLKQRRTRLESISVIIPVMIKSFFQYES